MIVSSLGRIDDAIQIPDGMTVFEFFRVRVMVGEPLEAKCIAVEDFQEFPDDAQVAWSVIKNNGSYAEITKILVPQTLPFSECDGCSDDCGCCENCETEDDVPY